LTKDIRNQSFSKVSDFDAFKDSYKEQVERAISFVPQDHDYFTEVKARCLVDIARRRLGDPREVAALDVGCGIGETDRFLVEHFGRVHGVDVAAGTVEVAARSNPTVHYQVYDGEVLPFGDGTVDLAFAICVLHHVPPQSRGDLVAEMARVTRPGGVVALFEHNPLNPLTRRVVSRCDFDEDAVLLRQGEATRLLSALGLPVTERRYIVFFPFQRTVTATLERRLWWLPLGAQYYVTGEARR
jgi:SAM-dependent methyltransferase